MTGCYLARLMSTSMFLSVFIIQVRIFLCVYWGDVHCFFENDLDYGKILLRPSSVSLKERTLPLFWLLCSVMLHSAAHRGSVWEADVLKGLLAFYNVVWFYCVIQNMCLSKFIEHRRFPCECSQKIKLHLLSDLNWPKNTYGAQSPWCCAFINKSHVQKQHETIM